VFVNRNLVLRNEDRGVSGTPVVGSVLGCFAVLFSPIGTIGDRFLRSWVPLAVEAAVLGTCLP
jgi:hypothetical protein